MSNRKSAAITLGDTLYTAQWCIKCNLPTANTYKADIVLSDDPTHRNGTVTLCQDCDGVSDITIDDVDATTAILIAATDETADVIPQDVPLAEYITNGSQALEDWLAAQTDKPEAS